MPADLYGLPLTTSSPAARERYNEGARGLLAWSADALEHFQAALVHDEGLALAHAGAAVCHFLDERFKEARARAEAARAAAADATERERRHVEALALLVGGQAAPAERAMREHLAAFPRDLVVFQRLYFLFFFQGRFPEMLAMTEELVRHLDGDSFILGMHAFALEQADREEEALRTAERGLALNADDPWTVHAVAHALYEQSRSDLGLSRLPPAIARCPRVNWFRNHLHWHLALMHLALGRYDRARALSREVFEREPSSIAGDLHDSISLLWRFDLYGRPAGEAWRPFAAIARERLNRQGLLFHAVHLAMALAAAGEWETAGAQLAMLRERARKDPSGLVGDVVVPLVEGLHAFAGGDYPRAIGLIEPPRPRIVEIGGSRAQRDVFHETLVEACFRAGDPERAERILAERLLPRGDHYWVARRAAARAMEDRA
jgi:tetratricopeptide (TPR) repeat protein